MLDFCFKKQYFNVLTFSNIQAFFNTLAA